MLVEYPIELIFSAVVALALVTFSWLSERFWLNRARERFWRAIAGWRASEELRNEAIDQMVKAQAECQRLRERNKQLSAQQVNGKGWGE